jgi:peroxiredoxin family protein
MYCGAISAKSDLNRAYAACALGALARETCEHADVFATGGNDRLRKHATARVPARRGLSLVDAIFKMKDPLGGGGIFLTQCLDWVWAERGEKQADRVIVITDEQDCETNSAKSPLHARQIAKRQYLINVASYKPGIGYGAWHHIDGWSERVLDYIRAVEQESEYAG